MFQHLLCKYHVFYEIYLYFCIAFINRNFLEFSFKNTCEIQKKFQLSITTIAYTPTYIGFRAATGKTSDILFAPLF